MNDLVDKIRELNKENQALRQENDELKARITRMIAKYRALQATVKPQTPDDGLDLLRNLMGMK